MGALDDPAVREATLKVAGEIAGMALEAYHGRKLKRAEQDALLDAVREVERKRTFTPTDAILGRDEGPKNPEAAGTPDAES